MDNYIEDLKEYLKTRDKKEGDHMYDPETGQIQPYKEENYTTDKLFVQVFKE